MDKRSLFVAGCVISVAAALLGLVACIIWGGSLPPWLLFLELAMIVAGARPSVSQRHSPPLPPALVPPDQGGAVCLGVAVTFVPLQLVLAAFLIGAGTRLEWLSGCELESEESSAPDVSVANRGTEFVRSDGVPLATPERANGSRRSHTGNER